MAAGQSDRVQYLDHWLSALHHNGTGRSDMPIAKKACLRDSAADAHAEKATRNGSISGFSTSTNDEVGSSDGVQQKRLTRRRSY